MNNNKIILDLCGGTSSWAKPYKDAGYDVRTITLPENDIRDEKLQKELIALKPYGILAAPPCTKFSKAAWQIKKADRNFAEGMECVRACLNVIWGVQEQGAPLAFWALENPMGYLYNFLGQPTYYFQSWWFGDTSPTRTKRTAIWGYFNEPKRTVFKRDFAYISSHSQPAGDGTCDRERRNEAWGKLSVEDRAKTSAEFAQSFYEKNK